MLWAYDSMKDFVRNLATNLPQERRSICTLTCCVREERVHGGRTSVDTVPSIRDGGTATDRTTIPTTTPTFNPQHIMVQKMTLQPIRSAIQERV